MINYSSQNLEGYTVPTLEQIVTLLRQWTKPNLIVSADKLRESYIDVHRSYISFSKDLTESLRAILTELDVIPALKNFYALGYDDGVLLFQFSHDQCVLRFASSEVPPNIYVFESADFIDDTRPVIDPVIRAAYGFLNESQKIQFLELLKEDGYV